MHCQDNASHQHNIIGQIGLVVDQHFGEEYARVLEVAVEQWRRIRTLQIGSVHAVNGVQRSMECRSEVADVPHPAEHRSDVHVSRAESKYGEEDCQDGSNEHSEL